MQEAGKSSSSLFELIHKSMDGSIDDAEILSLQHRLLNNDEARQYYILTIILDTGFNRQNVAVRPTANGRRLKAEKLNYGIYLSENQYDCSCYVA